MIIVDGRLPGVYRALLEEAVFPDTLMPLDAGWFISGNDVYETIKYHPDIFFFKAGKDLVCSPNVDIDRLKRVIAGAGINIFKGEKTPSGRYPYTSAYNTLQLGKFLFHNLEYTDPVVIETAMRNGLTIKDVKQGYARCSALAVNEHAIVTSDGGIAKAASKCGIDVLLVSGGQITLPGEKYGFIGGTGRVLADGKLYIMGDLTLHNDFERIKKFLLEQHVSYSDIKGHRLYDGGGMVRL